MSRIHNTLTVRYIEDKDVLNKISTNLRYNSCKKRDFFYDDAEGSDFEVDSEALNAKDRADENEDDEAIVDSKKKPTEAKARGTRTMKGKMVLKERGNTPQTPKRRRTDRRVTSRTPYRLNKRTATYQESSSSESSDSEDSSYCPTDSDEEVSFPKHSSHPVERELSTLQRKSVSNQQEHNQASPTSKVESCSYFELMGNRQKTSNRTLSHLKKGTDLTKSLGKGDICPLSHKLREETKELHSQWMFQMGFGFNVMLYGVGSKRLLLDDFRQCCLKGHAHLVINGYFPALSSQQLLKTIATDVLKLKSFPSSEVELAKYLKEYYSKPSSSRLFLLINNIDGIALRSSSSQCSLLMLSQAVNVHVIATVDHINAHLLFDQRACSLWRWLWHEASTYLPYSDETSYETTPLLTGNHMALVLSSLRHVWRSLTPNAKGVFRQLAALLQDQRQSTNPVDSGITQSELYRRCRQQFLSSSEAALRAQLTEFIDHKLIKSRRGVDGAELLYIPIETEPLHEFLDSVDSNT